MQALQTGGVCISQQNELTLNTFKTTKIMKRAILRNVINGVEVEVFATTDHPASSYGQAVWVDNNNEAYMQVNMPSPFYEIVNQWDIDPLEEEL